MGQKIDTSSSHYKGKFPDIYAVERKYPNGGIDGDYVDIEGWAHYWNASRSTWCVNEKRDSYWDELITNLVDSISKIRGATYMGIATPETEPDSTEGAKMFYFARDEGFYYKFSDQITLNEGLSIIYTDGETWDYEVLFTIVQTLGNNPKALVSQKTITEIVNNLVDSFSIGGFVLYLNSSMGWSWRTYQLKRLNQDGSYQAFTTLNITARFNGLDVTDKIKNIVWERETGDEESDNAWNKAHASTKLSLPITFEDLGDSDYVMGNTMFTCTAEYETEAETVTTRKSLQF